ncbi:GIY-YIG nuclease family protein [Patescibacteria group bacterium]|nr:GIY-YIG nuclease family protein [Patescibacteria group bacterium]
MALLQEYYVYMMSNRTNSVIYTGCTNDLTGRVYQHKFKYNPKSFTAKYNVNKLVYYEVFYSPWDMINREKQIKNLVRRKKIELIEKNNPHWKDLSEDWDFE